MGGYQRQSYWSQRKCKAGKPEISVVAGRRDGKRKEGKGSMGNKGREKGATQAVCCKEAPLSESEADLHTEAPLHPSRATKQEILIIAPRDSTVSSDRTCSVWTRPQNRTERARNEVSVPLASLAESQKGLEIVLCVPFKVSPLTLWSI